MWSLKHPHAPLPGFTETQVTCHGPRFAQLLAISPLLRKGLPRNWALQNGASISTAICSRTKGAFSTSLAGIRTPATKYIFLPVSGKQSEPQKAKHITRELIQGKLRVAQRNQNQKPLVSCSSVPRGPRNPRRSIASSRPPRRTGSAPHHKWRVSQEGWLLFGFPLNAGRGPQHIMPTKRGSKYILRSSHTGFAYGTLNCVRQEALV